MPAMETAPQRPTVSVIIPARNEEACLGDCLQSLVVQSGVAFEIIVVDDHSTDRTREIASSFPSVQPIEAGPLPEGWTGKNNAVTAGARQACGEWLLFTDADTEHLPGSLARALAEAQANHAEFLSYSPEQIVTGSASAVKLIETFTSGRRSSIMARRSNVARSAGVSGGCVNERGHR